MTKPSQVSIDYHRSFRRNVMWRWTGDRKLRKESNPSLSTSRTDVVSLYHARLMGIPDRVAIKRILACKFGTGLHDADYVQLLHVEES